MRLDEYLLTYKDANGDVVANIFDYYERYIRPLRPEFQRYDLRRGLVLCWFVDHSDKNASMGTMRDKKHSGGHLYHCFGCNKVGNVIDMHRAIQRDYFNRTLTVDVACKELAQMFNIPLDEETTSSEDEFEASDIHFESEMRRLVDRYSVREFERELKAAAFKCRSLGEPLDLQAVQEATIKYIATEKRLYD